MTPDEVNLVTRVVLAGLVEARQSVAATEPSDYELQRIEAEVRLFLTAPGTGEAPRT